MASVLREGVPTVEQFQAWDFSKNEAIFATCFLNTMMRDYGTMTPPKKYMKANMKEYDCRQPSANILARTYRRMRKRDYARMVQGMAIMKGAKNMREQGAIPGGIVFNPDTMELVKSIEEVSKYGPDSWDV